MPETVDIYRDSGSRDRCLRLYEAALTRWPVAYEEVDVQTPFGATHVIVSGEAAAPPLVLLHGQWATATMWASLVEPLSAAFRVFAIDQIDDVGKSTPTRTPSCRDDYADWLLAVLDGLGLGTAGIAGLSYGGFLAANLALRAPERVTRLALLCPGLPSFGKPTLRWAVHGLPVTLFPTRRNAEWLVRGLSVHGYVPGDPEAEQLIVGAMGARSRVPFRPQVGDEEYAGLSMPVLFLVGAAEAMYDATEAAAQARRLIAGVEASIIPGAGHMLSADQHETVASQLVCLFSASRPAVGLGVDQLAHPADAAP